MDTQVERIKGWILYTSKLIGQGSFGRIVVCKSEQNPNMEMAAKIIRKSRDNRVDVRREMENLQKIKEAQNVNLLNCVDLIEEERRIIIIMEKCQCNLKEYVLSAQLSEEQCIWIMRQLLNGYWTLFEKKIMHRDLKPENVLLLNGTFKIMDFGMAKVIEEQSQRQEHTKVGSPYYLAYEVMEGTYDYRCDIYSLGVIFHFILFKKPVQLGRDLEEIYYKMIQLAQSRQTVKCPTTPSYSKDLIDLVERMLNPNVEARIPLLELCQHKIFHQQYQNAPISSYSPNENTANDNIDESMFTNSTHSYSHLKIPWHQRLEQFYSLLEKKMEAQELLAQGLSNDQSLKLIPSWNDVNIVVLFLKCFNYQFSQSTLNFLRGDSRVFKEYFKEYNMDFIQKIDKNTPEYQKVLKRAQDVNTYFESAFKMQCQSFAQLQFPPALTSLSKLITKVYQEPTSESIWNYSWYPAWLKYLYDIYNVQPNYLSNPNQFTPSQISLLYHFTLAVKFDNLYNPQEYKTVNVNDIIKSDPLQVKSHLNFIIQ